MNIIYIHSHDTGRYVQPYGAPVSTPNIMAFAQDSLLFRNYFTVNPTCSPSRASLLTGSYPAKNGMLGLSQRGFSLKDTRQHLASWLQQNGFRTALSGVQHEAGGFMDAKSPVAKSLGYQTILTDTDNRCLEQWDYRNAKHAADFLRSYDEAAPLFLSVGLFATHREYPELTEQELNTKQYNYLAVPPTMMDTEANRIDTARLHKSLKILDDCVGIVMDGLRQSGKNQDSIIILTTDHGLANPFEKCNLNDAGTRIMLMMKVPGRTHLAGQVSQGMVSQIDIYPTLCELAGLAIPGHVEGVPFTSLLSEEPHSTRDRVYGEVNFHTSYEPIRTVRTERYRFTKYFDLQWPQYNLSNIDASGPKTMLVDAGMSSKAKAMEQLYDLYYDPNEKNNLVGDPEYTQVYQDLKQDLLNWMEQRGDKFYSPQEYQPEWQVNQKACISPSLRSDRDREFATQP
ncbi:sulfatase [Photobacterium rosenbergii]|uniref:Sulfatase n=1 Tax=Photobacterium rosenbergii TaxID=294936 RepID=A0ABU3ZJ35_9GAMM|nr:sulfatase [Photobacterium rosenbergii]MDV5170004.1 sulfatase [Photobacterium rosenbergii]